MTNYTELKRLAEAAKAAFSNSYEHTSNRVDFEMAASPDVVLSMIDALDVQAGSIEAVQAANQRLAAERDKLRTQNQALGLTDEEMNALWNFAVETGNPTAGNAHLRFARAIIAAINAKVAK